MMDTEMTDIELSIPIPRPQTPSKKPNECKSNYYQKPSKMRRMC